MILINFERQDGENEYRDWDYNTDFSKADYDNGKVKDFDLLHNTYCVWEEDDLDDNNSYWDGDRLISVYSVQDIDQETLDILRRYV